MLLTWDVLTEQAVTHQRIADTVIYLFIYSARIKCCLRLILMSPLSGWQETMSFPLGAVLIIYRTLWMCKLPVSFILTKIMGAARSLLAFISIQKTGSQGWESSWIWNFAQILKLDKILEALDPIILALVQGRQWVLTIEFPLFLCTLTLCCISLSSRGSPNPLTSGFSETRATAGGKSPKIALILVQAQET